MKFDMRWSDGLKVCSSDRSAETKSKWTWATAVSSCVLSSGRHSFTVTVDRCHCMSWGVLPAQLKPYYSLIGWNKGSEGWAYFSQGKLDHLNSDPPYGGQYSAGDEITCEVHLDTGTLQFFKNGKSQGVAATGVKGPLRPAVSLSDGEVTLGTLTSFK